MEKIFTLAKNKCYENFDYKIYSSDKQFDDNVNLHLPRDIWISWLNGKREFEKEEEYIRLKNQIFAREKNRIVFLCENFRNLREIDFFDGREYREVYIKNFSSENSLVIGSAIFQNLRSFCLDKIKPKTQICLHFK